MCDFGWKGYDCSVGMNCPNQCSGHGNCIDSKCYCHNRWRGFDCSKPRQVCPDDFKCYRGRCEDTYCICDKGWTGDDCTVGDFHAAHAVDGFWESESEEDGFRRGGSASFVELWEEEAVGSR